MPIDIMLHMFSVGQVKSGAAWLSDTEKKTEGQKDNSLMLR